MIHLAPTDLLTGEPKVDAMITAGISGILCIIALYIPTVTILTIHWQIIFQNLAIAFSIVASILSVNKSTKFVERFTKWLKSKRK